MIKIILALSLITFTFSQGLPLDALKNRPYQILKACENYGYSRPDIFFVNGEASYSAIPTIGVVRFGIDVMQSNAGDALKASKLVITAATSGITQINSEVSLTTSGLSVQPQYEWSDKGQVLLGYQVTNNLVVRTTNIEELGGQIYFPFNCKSIIDAAIENGVNRVDSVSYEIDPVVRKENEDQLLELALADAQQRAIRTLDALNYQIVGIKSININANNYSTPSIQPNFEKMAMMADSAAPTQVFAGQQTNSFSLTVGFVIELKNE